MHHSALIVVITKREIHASRVSWLEPGRNLLICPDRQWHQWQPARLQSWVSALGNTSAWIFTNVQQLTPVHWMTTCEKKGTLGKIMATKFNGNSSWRKFFWFAKTLINQQQPRVGHMTYFGYIQPVSEQQKLIINGKQRKNSKGSVEKQKREAGGPSSSSSWDGITLKQCNAELSMYSFKILLWNQTVGRNLQIVWNNAMQNCVLRLPLHCTDLKYFCETK